jgi:hypothetical protein
MPILTNNRGLQTQKNALARPDGSLTVADNVVIDNDNTIQKRRGFSDYSSAAFASKPKQLFTYRSKILTHYANTLTFDSDNAGTFSAFSGSFAEVIAGLRLKGVEANGNFYFTSSTGIKKISAAQASDIAAGSVTEAGGIKAIDLSGEVVPDSAGFLPAQSKVAYRILFGTKDANNNLILGYPSSRLVVTNAAQDIEESEIFTVNVVDYTSITDGDYFTFDTADTGYFVWFKKTGGGTAPVVAEVIDRQPIMIDVQSLTSNSEVAAAIASELYDSVEGISVEVDTNEVEITIDEPGDVTDAGQGSFTTAVLLVTKVFDGSVTTGSPATVTLTSTLPSAITTDYFYQIYRTAITTVAAGQAINDIDPGDEQYFIYEAPITSADVALGSIEIEENTPDIFRESGAYLYTNATTGTGIASANERPPVAADIALFRNSVFYANTKDVHRFNFNLLSVDDFVSGTTKLFIGKEDELSTYTFTGVAEVTDITVEQKSLTVGNSYIELSSANNERRYYFWFDKGIIALEFDSTADVTSNEITLGTHGLATDDPITFTGTPPTGLSVGVTYYVIRIDSTTISVAATPGGAVIALSDVVGTATVRHTPNDPALASKLSIRVPLELYGDSDAESKQAIIDALEATGDFTAVSTGANTVRATCVDAGNADAPSLSTPSPAWSVSVFTDGQGEDAATNKVLLSSNSSVGTAIDLTARSLVRVINADSDCPIFAQYLTGAEDLPGKILLEAKSGEDVNFYVAINDSTLSQEFSPELVGSFTVSSIATLGDLFTTTAAHGFAVGNEVYVHDNPGSAPTEFGGVYTVATTPSSTTFTLTGAEVGINQPVITGRVFKTASASDNNEGPNRLYYSKALQPEAVPLGNYIDIGSKDRPILRILPLRDNLFVLKEDGIYIVSGEGALPGVATPFSQRLLDNSATLIAPDTAAVLNNQIYALTTQGVVSITETGVSIISRDIEDQIKHVTTFNYNFKYTSFGLAYESDRSYLLWLPTLRTDNVATQCYRYNSITGSWTRWVLSSSCGLVNAADDRLYVGGSERFFVSQERKDGTREDYSDRDFTRTIGADAISDTDITLSSTVDVAVGDVIVQEQYATVTKFNRLLKKLDRDSGPADNDYYDELAATTGDNLANKLLALATKLNADANLGSFTAPSGVNTKAALLADYNAIIEDLNDPTSGTALKDYKALEDLIKYEVLVTAVESSSNTVTVNFMPWLIQGEVTVYKGFECEVQWAPQHFGKPHVLKQIHEGSILFDVGTIYGATLAFSSDRSASFEEIDFTMQGPGFWASYPWADSVWGGGGSAIPFRTLIPFQKSRCRFMNVKFKHKNAREQFKLQGISLEVREISTRGYR